MRIRNPGLNLTLRRDPDPALKNTADRCGCGSATLVLTILRHFGDPGSPPCSMSPAGGGTFRRHAHNSPQSPGQVSGGGGEGSCQACGSGPGLPVEALSTKHLEFVLGSNFFLFLKFSNVLNVNEWKDFHDQIWILIFEFEFHSVFYSPRRIA